MKNIGFIIQLFKISIMTILIIIYNKLYIEYELIQRTEFRRDNVIILLMMMITICIGLLFGVNHFVQEMKKVGPWNINYIQLIILGIPILYVSLTLLHVILFKSSITSVHKSLLTNILSLSYKIFSNKAKPKETVTAYTIPSNIQLNALFL